MAIAQPGKLDDVRDALDQLNSEARSADEFMQGIALLLNQKMLKYNWVGFYMLEHGARPPILVLGHFQGAMTPHTRIPLHQGICGAAASTGKTVVVDDVSKDPRYLACSLDR
jgi:L-methionine (R)-S-oxide reductase